MFKPGNLNASSLQSLADSMMLELNRLTLGMSQPVDYLALKTLYAEPSRVFDGMVVKADGTTWNPGSGSGIYARDGGVWVKL